MSISIGVHNISSSDKFKDLSYLSNSNGNPENPTSDFGSLVTKYLLFVETTRISKVSFPGL